MFSTIPQANPMNTTTEDKTKPTERDSQPSQTVRLSTESKRQREGSDHVGAFGARTGHSDLIFLEGIRPEDEDASTIEAQASSCFDQLEEMLAVQGADLTDVMKMEVQLTDIDDKAAVDAVCRDRFGEEYPPRTTVGVCALPGNAKVQLDVIGADE